MSDTTTVVGQAVRELRALADRLEARQHDGSIDEILMEGRVPAPAWERAMPVELNPALGTAALVSGDVETWHVRISYGQVADGR